MMKQEKFLSYIQVNLLFLLVMDGVLRSALDGKKRGLTWRLQESLQDMEYADDVWLVSHT